MTRRCPVGHLAALLLPTAFVQPGAYAAVGMASVFSTAARMPLTALVIAVDLTDGHGSRPGAHPAGQRTANWPTSEAHRRTGTRPAASTTSTRWALSSTATQRPSALQRASYRS